MRHLRFPRLTPRIIRRDEELWQRIDLILRLDPMIRKAAFHVLEAQRHVRRTTNDLGWAAYGWVEEEVNARLVLIAITLVKWAFHEGFRCGIASCSAPQRGSRSPCECQRLHRPAATEGGP